MSKNTVVADVTDKINGAQEESRAGEHMLQVVGAVFFLSGFSSLLYQVAWQRLLTVNYGVGATSVTLIVGIYMLGLGLGALLGGKLSKKNPEQILNYYCLMEALLGVFGVLSIPILQALGLYTSGMPPFVYLVSIFAFLFLPTLLMGTTLPLLTEHMISRSRSFADAVSQLYFANTFGASLGALIGAYGLISIWGLDACIYVAAALNFVICLTVKTISQKDTAQAKPSAVTEQASKTGTESRSGSFIYAWIFVSGLFAIAMEIVWFRTIEIIIKSSPYAFASILGIYLLGIGLGSWLLNRLLKRRNTLDVEKLFFAFQLTIGLYVYYSYMLLTTHPFKKLVRQSNLQELHPNFTTTIFTDPSSFAGGWFTYLDIIIWPLFFILVPTLLMGACFPLLSTILHRTLSTSRGGEAVALSYFVNILGNVLGSIIAGFVLLHFFGTAPTVLILSLLVSFTFAPPLFRRLNSQVSKGALLLVLVLSLVLVKFYPSNEKLIAGLHLGPEGKSNIFVQEGADCVDIAFEQNGTVWHYINGLLHGGRMPHISGYYRRAAEGMSYAGQRKNVLVFGYGTGAIAELVARSKEVEKITIVELNQSVMTNLRKMPLFEKLLADNRIKLVIDDGRRYLNRSEERFDVILMDPLRSTTAYSNNIYSKEFFSLVKNRLSERGVLMVWLDDFYILPKTISTVFPHIILNSSFCLASTQPMQFHKDCFDALINGFDPATKERILSRSEHYLGDEKYIEQTCKTAPVNTDLHPFSEYHLGSILRGNAGGAAKH